MLVAEGIVWPLDVVFDACLIVTRRMKRVSSPYEDGHTTDLFMTLDVSR